MVGIDLNGLGVVRALGAAGVPVVALDTELDKPTAATRFGRKFRVGSLSGAVFIDELLALRQRLSGNPVLILTQEASVSTVSALRDRLAGAYRFTMPPRHLMEDLLDKLRFQALAERLGFRIPRAVRMSRSSDAERIRELRFPCVVKPTTKHPQYGMRFAKAYKVGSADGALRLWGEISALVEEIIIQEWIEGDDSDVYFCLQYRPPNSGRTVSFAGRKTCQWPPLVGGTASCIPAPEAAAELTALTNSFFEAIGFAGIGSMEYKRDTRDGHFYMVEPTVGRTDYQEEIAALNGINIPLATYLGELGAECPEAVAVLPPRGWRDPIGLARARMAGARDPMFELLPSVKVCDAYFRIDDPMPYIALKLQSLRNRLGRRKPAKRIVEATNAKIPDE